MTNPKMFQTPAVTPPGISIASAYQALDALGQVFCFNVPESGIVTSAIYYDKDDEGLAVDLLLFRDSPGQQVDNAAVSVPDTDVEKVIGRIQFTSFADLAISQFSEVRPISLGYAVPGGKLWALAVAQGALNIAAGALPSFRLNILPD